MEDKTLNNNKTPVSETKKSIYYSKINKKLGNKTPKDANFNNFLELDDFNLNQSPICTSQQNISENSDRP